MSVVPSTAHKHLLMRARDIPLTAVSTPSGMLLKCLVMPVGLTNNIPAIFNRLVTQLFRRHRSYAHTYFVSIFVHSRTEQGKVECDESPRPFAICDRVHAHV